MNDRLRYKTAHQADKNTSSWPLGELLVIRLWEVLWCVFLRWTPKKLNALRICALRLFGAKIAGHAFVFPSARIYAPFNLEMCADSCIGPRANVYNLGRLSVGARSVLSQECMICGGTHDLSSKRMPLLVGDVELGADVFVGTRALILPGVRIDEGAVVGAGAVVTKDVGSWMVVGGNPAHVLHTRTVND